jgi:WD40 repeat protein
MPNPSHPLHFSLVRLRDATGTIVGAGFLATPILVCTCAHVVADALQISRETAQPPAQEVQLDFPFLGEAEGRACIHTWVRMAPDEGGGDIAILRLMTAPPVAARPARLLLGSTLAGKEFAAYGFPSATDVGQYAYGILRDRLANGYLQLEGTTAQGYRIQQGYSGTPVWNQHGRGVVGMVVAADRAPDSKVAFLIPNNLILDACQEVKPTTFRPLLAPLIGLSAPFGGRQVQLLARSPQARSATIIRSRPSPKRSRRKFLIIAGIGLVTAGGSSLFLYQRGKVQTTGEDTQPHMLTVPLVAHTHTSSINSVAWSPTQHLIASASDDGEIRIWEALKGESPIITYKLPLQSDGTPNNVWWVSWSPDGRFVASASADPVVHIWDASQQRDTFIRSCIGHSDSVNSVTWSPDGKYILSGSADKTIRVWSSQGALQGTYKKYENAVTSVAWSHDGARIAGGSRDKSVRVWDATTSGSPPLLNYPRHTGAVNCISWSPDGNSIASGSDDRTVQVWDPISGEVKQTYRKHHDVVNPVAWSPNSKYIISGSWDHTARIWDAMHGNTIAICQHDADHVNAVAWSSDGQYVATGGKDNSVYVWKVF